MTQMTITGTTTSFALNVTEFNSVMMEQENSAQCKNLQVHFPIRMAQPNVAFDVVFSSDLDYQAFQLFLRGQQQLAIANSQLVTLLWPDRNIYNWTGVISKFEGGDMRWNYAPHSHFEVQLVDSLLAYRTYFQSISAYWTSIYGINMPGGVLNEPSLTPTQALQQNGVTFLNGGNDIVAPNGLSLNVPTGTLSSGVGVITGTS